MIIKILVAISLTLVSLIYFHEIEYFALGLGISWTLAKILPYLILILDGVVFFMLFKKQNFKPLITVLVRILILIMPFTIGFIINPIYKEDFSASGTKINNITSSDEFRLNGLNVVTIPDCPYCMASIQDLKILKKRIPNLKIEFIVCSSNKKALENYRKEINGLFKIRLAKKPEDLASIAEFKFPTFIIVKKNKPTYKWSNNEFGVCSKDELESVISQTN